MSTGNEFQAPGSASPAVDYGTTGGTIDFQAMEAEALKRGIPPGWHRPLPEKLPSPGYWPAIGARHHVYALGTYVGSNQVVSTIVIIFFIGLVLFIGALAGWIGDMRHERKDWNG
jgi:hypothetical protein